MKRVLYTILTVTALLLLVCSCQTSKETAQAQPEVRQELSQELQEKLLKDLQGSPWVNSNIYANWPASRPALQDHYELYVNYELYMKDLQENITSDNLYDQSDVFTERILKQLIADTSKTSDELELIRGYYRLFSDFDQRNAQGTEPLVNYSRMITSTQNVKELSQEVQKGLVFGNPFAKFVVDKAADGSGKYGVYIDYNLPLSSSLDANYTQEDMENLKSYYVYLLTLAGYNEEYAVDIMNLVEQFEIKAAQYDAQYMSQGDNESDIAVLTLDEIRKFCEPLYDLIIGLGYYSQDGNPVCYMISNAGIFYGIDMMYMDDNLELLKAIYVIAMAQYSLEFLDMDTYASVAGLEPGAEIDTDEISYLFITNYLSGAVDQVFLEFVFPEGLRDQITELTVKYLDAMEARLRKEEWLSDQTREKALEKLDDMVYVVVYPNYWLDYSELRDLVQDHDQFLLDAVLCRDDFYREYTTSFIGEDIDRGNWVFSDTKTTEANAYYMSNENSINILAGVLYDSLFYQDSIETILASIGATIGHEITHGFDTGGAQYNGTGDSENWWTEEDAANFSFKAGLIADALNVIYLTDDLAEDGYSVLDEMVADLGGLALSLDIAKQYPDFDYDKFFKIYALMWYAVMADKEAAEELYYQDSHAASYVRANFTLQMFDEFYSTYPEVTEGSGMYRSPDERLSVW